MRIIAQVDTLVKTIFHTKEFPIQDVPDDYIVYEVPKIKVDTLMPWVYKDICFKYGNIPEYQVLGVIPAFMETDKCVLTPEYEYLFEGDAGYSLGYVDSEGRIMTEHEIGQINGYIILGQADNASEAIKSTFIEEIEAPPIPKAPTVEKVTMNMFVREEDARDIYNDLNRREKW